MQGVDVKEKDIGKEKVKVLEVSGILDSITMPEADKVISEFIDKLEKAGLCLILDFDKLRYINSTGILKLMIYFIKMQNGGGNLKLVVSSEIVYSILDILGATKVLKIYDTLEKALEDIA